MWQKEEISSSGRLNAKEVDPPRHRDFEDGTTTFVKAGPAFEILGANKLDSLTLANPVAADNQIFIRTAAHLYCIQQK